MASTFDSGELLEEAPKTLIRGNFHCSKPKKEGGVTYDHGHSDDNFILVSSDVIVVLREAFKKKYDNGLTLGQNLEYWQSLLGMQAIEMLLLIPPQ